MSRRARLVILCEDNQHEAFARRFLAKVGHRPRDLRIVKAQRAVGSGEQFVREAFPRELAGLRRTHVSSMLIVLIDGDVVGPVDRINALHAECADRGIQRPTAAERVYVFVPTRSIETWLAYLAGGVVDEGATYPHLPRERDCQVHVDTLAELCIRRRLRQPAPSSLVAACREYERFRAG